ncbi:MAG: hypothetical protein AB1762_02665 [Gemmatimonadota bacterium]
MRRCTGAAILLMAAWPVRAQVTRSVDDVARWREDLRFFAAELPSRHVQAFKYVAAEQFAREVAAFDAAIPRLSDAQIRWRFMRLTALLRDGHTNAQIPQYGQRLPVTMFWHDDGPYITAATAEHAALLGRRVVRLNGHDVKALGDTVRLYLPHENEYGFRARAGFILFYPGAQRDVGLGTDSSATTLELETRDGRRSTVTLSVVPRAGFAPALPPNGEPLYRQRLTEKYWFVHLPDAQTVFVKYNQCRDNEAFRALTDSVMRLMDSGATRLVVDLRNNSGGSSQVIKPLIAAIRARPSLNQPQSLYAIIGRATFSSGMAAAHDFRTQTNGTIVGEPIGERPNTFGELRRFTLPNSKIEVSYSTRFYRLVEGEPDAFTPDTSVVTTPQSIVEGRDAVLEWIFRQR